MNWLIPALLAPAIYTVVNYIDKFIVSKEVKNYRAMPIYATITGLIVGTIFWIVTGFPLLNLKDTIIVMLTGTLTIWGAYFYFEAMSKDEASKLILWFQITPIFVLTMAYAFLGESLNSKQLLGFTIILAAVLIASVQKGSGKIHISRSFFLILAVNVLWAIAAILIKFALDANSFAKILSYESWGLALGGALLYLLPPIREAFNESVVSVRKRVLGMMFLNEGFFVVAKSITFFAYSIGPTALVSVIGTTQVFFGILCGWVLTLMWPKIFKESISRGDLTKKFLAGMAVLTGIILIQI